jgi:hypothetical protein
MNNSENKKVEDILGSLDGIRKTTAPDFFYTRLKARMEKGYESSTPKSWILRPAYAMSALVIIVLVNAAVIFSRADTKQTNFTETDTLQSIAAEYRLNDNDNTNLYDLNFEK